jgi:hypothetical protein
LIQIAKDKDAAERMKKLLGWGCWLLVLWGGVWPAAALAGDQPSAKDCRLQQLASIDMTIGSVVLLPVVVNGTATYMGINSSLPVSVISLEAANEMKLAISKAPELFSSSPGVVSLDSLSIGSYDMGKVRLLVFPGKNNVMPGMPASIGAIAIPQQLNVDYELDFAHRKMNLFSTDHCPGKVVYWADKSAAIPYTVDRIGIPIFPIELDGKKIAAALQVGGSGTRLKTDVSKALYGFDEHSPGIRTETLDSGRTLNHYRAMKMTLPGLSVTNADVQLVAGLAKTCEVSAHSGPEHSATYKNCFGNPPLSLGLDVLRHLRLYFATEEHILYVTEADATRAIVPATQ